MDVPMEKHIKVSVWMVTYNHERFISQAIESVLMQKTNFDYELVIGEDCSTDGTRAIICDYAKRYPERIRLLLQEHNLGEALNEIATMNACQGEYLAILEGDDYWTDPYKLQKQVDFLDSNPEYVVCHHDEIVVDEDGISIGESELPDAMKRDFSGDELIKGSWILTLSACYRNVIKVMPPEYHKVFNTDTFLFSTLGNYGCSKYMGREIKPAAYRHHKGGVWSTLGANEARPHTLTTYYWLSRYYGSIGKKEYMRHWAGAYHAALLWLLEIDELKYTAEACREYLIRHENFLDARFSYHFILHLLRTLSHKVYLKSTRTMKP
jgi:glycosyltransferase involved in cell wall biosynthesis